MRRAYIPTDILRCRYFVAILTVIAVVESAVTDIECERVELTADEQEQGYAISRGTLFTNSYEACFMNNNTVTDADDLKIATTRDLAVGGLRFDNNKNIQFLPILVYRTFPNLQVLVAANCSLREISKKNFQQLNKLEKLRLEKNMIEKISSDTFEGLVQLEKIYLSKFQVQAEQPVCAKCVRFKSWTFLSQQVTIGSSH